MSQKNRYVKNDVICSFSLEELVFRSFFVIPENSVSLNSKPYCIIINSIVKSLCTEQSQLPEAIQSIEFALNELLENAIKYNHSGSIIITVGLKYGTAVCIVSNQILSNSVAGLREKLIELITEDPNKLLIRQVEENFSQQMNKQSGLGFLVLLGDYQANLGWKFESLSHELTRIHTMVRLPVFGGVR